MLASAYAERPQKMSVEYERQRRMRMWASLENAGGPSQVQPTLLRDLRIYGGAQGIWVDKRETMNADPDGVTVSVLHKGTIYPDDLSQDVLVYHYPATERGGTRDESEVEATKAAKRLRLPVFVVTLPSPTSPLRDVAVGWVEDWDDQAKQFLILIGAQPPPHPASHPGEEPPFELSPERAVRCTEVSARVGQQRFKFGVMKRYGSECAFCGVTIKSLLDAAHVCPVEFGGCDDPRNGLVLCALHHRAFDAGLVGIDPENTQLVFRNEGPDGGELRISRISLTHLVNRPHPDAIAWAWNHWTNRFV